MKKCILDFYNFRNVSLFSMCFCSKILLLIKRRNGMKNISGELRVGKSQVSDMLREFIKLLFFINRQYLVFENNNTINLYSAKSECNYCTA